MTPASGAATGPARRRLHPLTPLLRGARSLAAVIAAVSWQGYARLGPANWLIAVAAVLVIVLLISVVSWAVTGFTVTGRELRIVEGLLWRRTRVIPLERVQAVDLVEPVLARVFGLAELHLEVIGGQRAEGSLAFLTVADAEALRGSLLAMAGGAVGAHPAGAPATAPPPADGPYAAGQPADGQPAEGQPAEGQPAAGHRAGGRFVHATVNRDVLVGHLMTVPTLLAPVALVAAALPLVVATNWSFVGVASTLTALVGAVQAPVRRILTEWNFQIHLEPSGLRLRHGLLETRTQTVPPQRVQAVAIVRPLLWRRLGWHRVRIDVAGYGGQEAGLRGGTLLPVADAAATTAVVDLVLAGACGAGGPGPSIADIDPPRPPARARWLAPIAWPVTGFVRTDLVVAASSGRLTRQLLVAPLARVQSVRVVQGPLQRALRLASVHVDTAGIGLPIVGRHLDATEAYRVAAAVAAAAMVARRHTDGSALAGI